MKSKYNYNKLAWAGLGTALSLVCVTFGYFIKNLSLTFLVLSSVGVMFPLTQKFYKESLLTAFAVSVIGFFVVNINILTFVLGASFYVVFTVFWKEKRFNVILGYVIKILYSIVIFFILYQLTSLIVVDFTKIAILNNATKGVIYLFINILFSLAFLVYDFLLVRGYYYLIELLKRAGKGSN